MLEFCVISGTCSSTMTVLTHAASGALYLITNTWFILHCTGSKSNVTFVIHESYTPSRNPEISLDDYFVPLYQNSEVLFDKTLFIKDVLEDQNKVLLITCPRRWGKSVNLNMLAYFLQSHFEQFGNRSLLNTTSNYRLFVDGEVTRANGSVLRLKTPPLISRHKHIIKRYLGKHPVIYMRLISCRWTFTAILYEFYEHLRRAFEDHLYIIDSYVQIIKDEKAKPYTVSHAREMQALFRRYCYEILNPEPRDVIDIMDMLSEVLYEHYGERVYVLIDDCFNTWKMMLSKRTFQQSEKKQFLKFYTDFMNVLLKNNTYIAKVVLMDSIPLPQELREYTFSDVAEWNPLNGKHMKHFGINQREMNELLQYINIPTDTQNKIRQWYRGTKVNNQDLEIANFLSINRFLAFGEFKYYCMCIMYINPFMQNFLNAVTFREKLLSLTEGKSILVTLDQKHFTWDDYDVLLSALNTEVECSDEFSDKAFMLLFYYGYLTLAEDCDINSNGTHYRMKFPNKEITSYMEILWHDIDKIMRAKIRRMEEGLAEMASLAKISTAVLFDHISNLLYHHRNDTTPSMTSFPSNSSGELTSAKRSSRYTLPQRLTSSSEASSPSTSSSQVTSSAKGTPPNTIPQRLTTPSRASFPSKSSNQVTSSTKRTSRNTIPQDIIASSPSTSSSQAASLIKTIFRGTFSKHPTSLSNTSPLGSSLEYSTSSTKARSFGTPFVGSTTSKKISSSTTLIRNFENFSTTTIKA